MLFPFSWSHLVLTDENVGRQSQAALVTVPHLLSDTAQLTDIGNP